MKPTRLNLVSLMNSVESVEKFNNVAGWKDPDDQSAKQMWEALLAQAKVNLEEAKEAYQACLDKNLLEVLDGGADSFVTSVGLLQKLKSYGFNVENAVEDVCENNLSKYLDSFTQAKADEAAYSLSHPEDKIEVIESDIDYLFVLKDKNGKIRKPKNFKPVELVKYLPYITRAEV